ncbi:MAG: hypothetical protein ACI9UA_005980, partial [Pseudoalteromonas tetraodonis]
MDAGASTGRQAALNFAWVADMLWVPLADSLQILSDIHILGGSTESLAICSLGSDEPDWLCGSPVCALLSQHHILHAGIMTAR